VHSAWLYLYQRNIGKKVGCHAPGYFAANAERLNYRCREQVWADLGKLLLVRLVASSGSKTQLYHTQCLHLHLESF